MLLCNYLAFDYTIIFLYTTLVFFPCNWLTLLKFAPSNLYNRVWRETLVALITNDFNKGELYLYTKLWQTMLYTVGKIFIEELHIHTVI